MNPPVRAWDRFWFAPLDPLPLGVFRIVFGITLGLYYLALGPHWGDYYGDLARGLHAAARRGPPHLSVFTWTEGIVSPDVFWWIGVAAAVVFAVGLRPRLAALVLLVLHTSMATTNTLLNRGEDVVFRLLLFGCVFAPLGHCLSLDAWLRTRFRRPPPEPPTAWAVRLMQVNLALVYVFSLPRKLTVNPDWLDGTAFAWIALADARSRWPWPEGFYGEKGVILAAVLTYGTLVVQAAFPLLVWFRRTRPVVLAAAALMHLGIGVMLEGLEFFAAAMLSGFVLFVPGEPLRRVFGGRSGDGR